MMVMIPKNNDNPYNSDLGQNNGGEVNQQAHAGARK